MEITTRSGERVRTTSKAWWMDRAIINDGLVIVARIEAESLDRRYPSAEQLADDPGLNRYWTDASNKGKPVMLMVGLTDDDLTRYGLTPGKVTGRPDSDGGTEVIASDRPTANRTDDPVAEEQYLRALSALQNEGCDDPEIVDNTPWQKGDDQVEGEPEQPRHPAMRTTE